MSNKRGQRSSETVGIIADKSPVGQIKKSPRDEKLVNLSDTELFDRAVTEYYYCRSIEADPSSFESIVDNALQSERLAQQILSMPALSGRQVLAKLAIIDAELLSDLDCEAPIERRHLLAFAALKVDIVRLLAEHTN